MLLVCDVTVMDYVRYCEDMLRACLFQAPRVGITTRFTSVMIDESGGESVFWSESTVQAENKLPLECSNRVLYAEHCSRLLNKQKAFSGCRKGRFRTLPYSCPMYQETRAGSVLFEGSK